MLASDGEVVESGVILQAELKSLLHVCINVT